MEQDTNLKIPMVVMSYRNVIMIVIIVISIIITRPPILIIMTMNYDYDSCCTTVIRHVTEQC